MLSGEVPFNSITHHRTPEDIVEDITRSKLSYDTPAWKNVSQAAKDLVKGQSDHLSLPSLTLFALPGLLTVDPAKRLTIKDLSRNAWLRGSTMVSAHDHQHLLLTPSILCQASRSLIVSFPAERSSRAAVAAGGDTCSHLYFLGSCGQCDDACIPKSRSISIIVGHCWPPSSSPFHEEVDRFLFVHVEFNDSCCTSQ